MKVTSTKPPSFQPFTLSITFETPEEAAAFFAVFNWTPNANLFADKGSGIRDAIHEACPTATRLSHEPHRSMRELAKEALT